MGDAYYLKNRNRETNLSINATTAAGTSTLKAGQYTVYCVEGVDCFIRTGASALDTMDENSQRLIAGNMIEIIVEEGDKVFGMSSSGAATLEICKVL
ncbi:MAG: hypothetical protein KGN35_12460 [Betaproteobacteria bacterium]|nr:hypothetical protein [Betaproteobacteria bacterium]